MPYTSGLELPFRSSSRAWPSWSRPLSGAGTCSTLIPVCRVNSCSLSSEGNTLRSDRSCDHSGSRNLIVTGSLEDGREPFRPKENNKMPTIPAIFVQPGHPGRTTSILRFDAFKILQLQSDRSPCIGSTANLEGRRTTRYAAEVPGAPSLTRYPERCVMKVPSLATHYPRTLAVMPFPF